MWLRPPFALWSFPDLADVLVGSEHIDQSRTRIMGRIDFAVLRPEMVFDRKPKKRGNNVLGATRQTPT